MNGSLAQWLNGVPDERTRVHLQTLLNPIADRLSSHCITSAGLRIHGASASPTVQAHTVVYAIANGVIVTKAIDTDMAALVGTVTNGTFNVYAFYLDSAGTLTAGMGTGGAALANVVPPVPPVNKAVLGWLVINPTGTGDFVGGTTNLDDATVVPNAVFINFTGPVDASIKLF